MPRIAFRNFTGGEVTSTLSARYDLKKAGTFLQCCLNFLPNARGDVARRPGTRFLADLGEPSVLLPFSFNSEAGNNYALVFGAGKLRIYDTEGVLRGGPLASPYALSDVYEISYAQTGDIVYLAHKRYPLYKVTRSGSYEPYTWELRKVTLNASLAAPMWVGQAYSSSPLISLFNKGAVKFTVGWTGEGDDSGKNMHSTLSYKVSAVDEDGIESLPSVAGGVKNVRAVEDWIAGDSATLKWQAVDGAKEYNIYRDSGGYYGLIGISETTTFQDTCFEADTSMTPKEDWNPFENGNNPGAVCFHQQRLALGGTVDDPASIFMSRTSDFESFRKSFPLQDDDPVEYMLASGSVDEVRWLTSFGDLLVGTTGAEYKATSAGAALTPSDVIITSQSFWGSANLQPLVIGQSVLHCQRHGYHVRDLFYSVEADGYSGNDLSLLAPQLVEGYGLMQWCYQQSPGGNVWMVRNDGALCCLTYLKEQNINAWSRHTTAGSFLSAICLSGNTDILLAPLASGDAPGDDSDDSDGVVTANGDGTYTLKLGAFCLMVTANDNYIGDLIINLPDATIMYADDTRETVPVEYEYTNVNTYYSDDNNESLLSG